MSIQAYQRAATQAETPREAEYRVFGDITAALLRAKENGAGFEQLTETLEVNRRYWSALSADCSLPENGLPLPLRAQIISLALWVARHTSDVLRTGAELDPLIDVNRMMMEGLLAR